MIVAIGDLIEDIVVVAPAGLRLGTDSAATVERHRGGSAANVAAAVARLGGHARFIGNVGVDAAGHRLVDQLRETGAEVVGTRTGRAGTIVAIVDGSGERSFLTDRGASDQLTDTDPSWLDDAGAVHVPLYSLGREPLRTSTLALVDMARDRGCLVSVDASSVALLDELGDEIDVVLGRIDPDVVFANGDEATVLAPSGRWPPTLGPQTVIVVKHGPRPTIVVQGADTSSFPVPPVDRVVDTIGAGDAFAAGYLSAVVDGRTVADGVAAGHAAAARTLGVAGAW